MSENLSMFYQDADYKTHLTFKISPNSVILEGFDQAILGVAYVGGYAVLVYKVVDILDALVEEFRKEDHNADSLVLAAESIEYFHNNILCFAATDGFPVMVY